MDVEKSQRGSPFQFFSALWDFSKILFHKRVPNSSILSHFEVLLLFLSLRYGADLGRSLLVTVGETLHNFIAVKFDVLGKLLSFSFRSDSSWESRWVKSKHDTSKFGEWKYTAGKFYGDAEKDKGIQTGEDARFYGISAKLEKPFSNEKKDLVIQFQIKHEQKIDCGGGYLKVCISFIFHKIESNQI